MAKQFKFDGLIKQAEQQKAQAEQKTQTSEIKTQGNLKDKIKIKDEFKFLIPPLMDDELAKLEESILAEGCRDPLVIWKNGDDYILIDGHNRFAICQKHNLDFKTEILEFANTEQVTDWMVNNQLGKRNVTEETKSYLRGMQYNREKKKVGENQYTLERVGQNVPSQSTADRLAEIHKVSEKTIKRDEKYAEAVNKLVGEDTLLKFDILNKKLNLPKGSVMKLAEETDDLVRQIGKLLKEGISFNQAILQAKPKQNNEAHLNPLKEKLKSIKSNIIACLDEAIKQQSNEPLEELKEFLLEFENALK